MHMAAQQHLQCRWLIPQTTAQIQLAGPHPVGSGGQAGGRGCTPPYTFILPLLSLVPLPLLLPSHSWLCSDTWPHPTLRNLYKRNVNQLVSIFSATDSVLGSGEQQETSWHHVTMQQQTSRHGP